MEQLTPIDEEPSEDEANDEDQPITMIPKIMHTAPSPTTDQMSFPPTSNVTSTTTVNHEQQHHQQATPKHNDSAVKLAESIEPTKIPEITIEKENEKQLTQTESNATDTATSGKDNEVSQIESVL